MLTSPSASCFISQDNTRTGPCLTFSMNALLQSRADSSVASRWRPCSSWHTLPVQARAAATELKEGLLEKEKEGVGNGFDFAQRNLP